MVKPGPLQAVVVLDGAADPIRGGAPTCLEAARTPVLDRLTRQGSLHRLQTIPAGLPSGTEVGLPTLLGVALAAAPSRGRIEAAAAGVDVGPDEGAWRLDLVPAREPDAVTVAALGAAVDALGGRVHHLRGHRLLLVGPSWWGDAPPGPHQTDKKLRELAVGPFAGVAKACKAVLQPGIAWPWGTLGGDERMWPQLDAAWVADGGAALGIGRLLGCRVLAPGASMPRTGLLVVHVPGPDDAAHARDRQAKIAAIEAADQQVLAPLVDKAQRITVVIDHGTDVVTGRHTISPVPGVVWPAHRPAGRPTRCTERLAATQAVQVPSDILDLHQVAVAGAQVARRAVAHQC